MAFMESNTLNIAGGRCMFTGNAARGGHGGAVYVSSSVVIVDQAAVAFTNNSAMSGSALYLSSSSSAVFALSNSTQKVRCDHHYLCDIYADHVLVHFNQSFILC